VAANPSLRNISLLCLASEGAARYVRLVRAKMTVLPRAERRHTKYDPDLGWVNEPSVHIPDMYGLGVDLRTNSQGFRNNHDFATVAPNGKNRIICSGDSFTLGYGVDNDHTWCQQLISLDLRLETLNAGQGGYGLDQTYLWYKRDVSHFDHQVHLLAFIIEDFTRMQSDRFGGYGKPVIQIENGMLVVKNVPVPKPPAALIKWFALIGSTLKSLRTVELFERVLWKRGLVPVPENEKRRLEEMERNEKTQQVLVKIFEDLKRLNEARASKLVLVYIPMKWELEGDGSQEWIRFIEKATRDLGIPLINLFSPFRSLPKERVVSLYIPAGQIQYPHADGHLTNEGNEFVARMIYEGMKNDPALSRVLTTSVTVESPTERPSGHDRSRARSGGR
jgi:hypothetical protein